MWTAFSWSLQSCRRGTFLRVYVCVCVCVVVLYISYHVHWSEINAYITSGLHSGIAAGRVFWDVTPFRQQIAYVSRDRIFFTVIERVLKHICPIITFGERFCCYFFVSLFKSLLSLIPFSHAWFSFFLPFSSKISLCFLCWSCLCYLCYFMIASLSLLPYFLNDYISVITWELSVTKLSVCSSYGCVMAMSSALRSEISLTFLLVREKVTGVLPLFLVHEFDEKVGILRSSWLIVANEFQ